MSLKAGDDSVVEAARTTNMWTQQPTGLRPLRVGERIDAAIKILRANFLTLLKATLPIAVPLALLQWLVDASISGGFSGLSSFGISATPGTGALPSGTTLFGGAVGLLLITLIANAAATAVSFWVVANSYLGRAANWKQALGNGLRRLHSVLWIQFLITIPLVVLGGLLVLLVIVVAHASVGLAVALGLLLGLACFIAYVWYWVSTSLAIATLMLENVR
ncbi:MAG TPA: hypothetical protein VGP46_11610, partial [Acidimicrobiales bacterium]|nr:hypothetical protein [Acidimicrobiales bacterium]